ncbi:MAG: hypothetical protein SWY16_26065 [Cyanobacteriota bacterium]|nr:hypothetical protein [Cyanobacteriota bacterium]
MTLKKNQKLATFGCDRQQWETFLARAAENGTSGAELLKWFTAAYIDGDIDPRQYIRQSDVERLADALDKRLAPLVNRLNELDARLGKSSGKIARFPR